MQRQENWRLAVTLRGWKYSSLPAGLKTEEKKTEARPESAPGRRHRQIVTGSWSAPWVWFPAFKNSLVISAQSLSFVCLFCRPLDCSPPGSSAHRISQARIQEWVAISSSRASFQTRDRNCISCIGRMILFTPGATREAQQLCYLSLLG